MKRLCLKLGLFIIPYVIVIYAMTFLPLNFFTFRLWEGLSVYKLGNKALFLPGPFYPSQRIAMVEEGDLGHGTPYAVKKHVYWETDRYGYRKSPSGKHPEIVIIGDSNIVGSSLSQQETISEVMERKLQTAVYPYAPNNINDFVRDPRFKMHPPKIVIFSQMERSIFINKPLAEKRSKKVIRWNDDYRLQQLFIVADRMLKLEPINYLRAKITPKPFGVRYQDMFFFEGETAVTDFNDKEIDKCVNTLIQYGEFFKKQKIQFIYMPIPNKETIYYDYLPSRSRSLALQKVLAKLERSGVVSVDLLNAYDTLRQTGGSPYQKDDSHWNAVGVKIAAELLEGKIKPLDPQNIK